jgi:hypothetical protein
MQKNSALHRDIASAQVHGSLFEPTVLTGTKPNMKVNCQEIFAPVVTVEPYNDFASALKQVNSSAYGLQAGLFTRDATLIFQAYDELEVGGLIAGDVSTFRIDHMPYGGIKDSGLGREGLRDAIQEMTEPKLLVMMGLPASNAMVWANSSLRSRMPIAIWRSTRWRSKAGSRRVVPKALTAAAMAASACSRRPWRTCAIREPS